MRFYVGGREYMKPSKAIPDCRPVIELVKRLYSGEDDCTMGSGGAGGHLHIVLDDDNLNDDSVQFCIDLAEKDNCITCLTLAKLMLQLSTTQRKRCCSEGTR